MSFLQKTGLHTRQEKGFSLQLLTMKETAHTMKSPGKGLKKTVIREILINQYISNFSELSQKARKNLLKDLEVFGNSILSSLVANKSKAIILPLNNKFTDLKEYSHLKGKPFYVKGYGKHDFYKTFDEVRGWGGNPAVIGEEWVVANDKHIFNVVRHEIAHQIHGNVLNTKVLKKIHKSFADAKEGKRFIRKNSSINEFEYFADGVAFYFNKSKSKKISIFDMSQICNRKLLFDKDEVLYNIVKDIFVRK